MSRAKARQNVKEKSTATAGDDLRRICLARMRKDRSELLAKYRSNSSGLTKELQTIVKSSLGNPPRSGTHPQAPRSLADRNSTDTPEFPGMNGDEYESLMIELEEAFMKDLDTWQLEERFRMEEQEIDEIADLFDSTNIS